MNELYAYQKEGVAWLHNKKGRALLADEMGLGKTIQTLAWLAERPDLRPAIVVCPHSVKLNWARESYKWLPNDRVSMCDGRSPNGRIIENAGVYVINYDILVQVYKETMANGDVIKHIMSDSWIHALGKLKPSVVVLDESHKIKDASTNQARGVMNFVRTYEIPHVVLLSGTPVINSPMDLWTSLQLLIPDQLPSKVEYQRRFCPKKNERYGESFGVSNMSELHERLRRSVMLRRMKEEVLSQLPPKRENHVLVEMNNREEYVRVLTEFLEWVEENYGTDAQRRAKHAEALVRMNHLRQVCAKGKLPYAIEWVRDFLLSGRKLVLFGIHKVIMHALADAFPGCAVITGETPLPARQYAIDRFQKDADTNLFVGNIKAAGVGITLTASSDVAFVELPWTLADLTQASDRVHRIGQEQSVMIHYLLTHNTVETDLLSIIQRKAAIVNAVVDGGRGGYENTMNSLIDSMRRVE